MKKIIISFAMVSLLSGVCVYSQQDQPKAILSSSTLKLVRNVDEYDVYKIETQSSNGEVKRNNGIRRTGEACMILLTRVRTSSDDFRPRAHCLDPEISDDKFKHTKNVTIDAPGSSAEYRQQKKDRAERMKKLAIAALTADSDDDSDN